MQSNPSLSSPQAGSPADATRPRAPRRALVSWTLFDWSVQPFYTLILTFLFAPYFANAVVNNAVCGSLIKEGSGPAACGQTLWGYAAAGAGILIAIGSPFLGALADGRGRRKPWIAMFILILTAAMASLWFAEPGASTLSIGLILLAVLVATTAAEYSSVFTNALMPSLVSHGELGRLSGIGWAVGYAGGLVALIAIAGLLVANAETGKTLLGLDPLLKFDGAAQAGDRMTGPFAAAWLLVFIIPFFLFVPDKPVEKLQASNRTARAELWDTIKSLPKYPSMLFFLIARMIYSDGLSAIFAFGGIYGASVFGWGPQELGIFGIVLTLTGAIGAVIGGFLDDKRGAKPVIVTALAILIIGALGILSVDKTHVFYTIEVAPKAEGSGPFSSMGEWVFLGFAMLVGIVAAPVQAASRSLLARLAPPDKVTQYFGLFAFSGKVTAFLAPFMVATVTAATGNQRLGMASITLFLVLGMLLMLPVKAPR